MLLILFILPKRGKMNRIRRRRWKFCCVCCGTIEKWFWESCRMVMHCRLLQIREKQQNSVNYLCFCLMWIVKANRTERNYGRNLKHFNDMKKVDIENESIVTVSCTFMYCIYLQKRYNRNLLYVFFTFAASLRQNLGVYKRLHFNDVGMSKHFEILKSNEQHEWTVV